MVVAAVLILILVTREEDVVRVGTPGREVPDTAGEGGQRRLDPAGTGALPDHRSEREARLPSAYEDRVRIQSPDVLSGLVRREGRILRPRSRGRVSAVQCTDVTVQGRPDPAVAWCLAPDAAACHRIPGKGFLRPGRTIPVSDDAFVVRCGPHVEVVCGRSVHAADQSNVT